MSFQRMTLPGGLPIPRRARGSFGKLLWSKQESVLGASKGESVLATARTRCCPSWMIWICSSWQSFPAWLIHWTASETTSPAAWTAPLHILLVTLPRMNVRDGGWGALQRFGWHFDLSVVALSMPASRKSRMVEVGWGSISLKVSDAENKAPKPNTDITDSQNQNSPDEFGTKLAVWNNVCFAPADVIIVPNELHVNSDWECPQQHQHVLIGLQLSLHVVAPSKRSNPSDEFDVPLVLGIQDTHCHRIFCFPHGYVASEVSVQISLYSQCYSDCNIAVLPLCFHLLDHLLESCCLHVRYQAIDDL